MKKHSRADSFLLCFLVVLAYVFLVQFGVAQNDSTVPKTPVPLAGHIRLSEILILTPQPYDLVQVDQARQKAEHALDELRNGASFESVARAESQGPTAERGGDLGYYQRGVLATVLEDQLFRMSPGTVSEVTRTKQGFAIFKVTERREEPFLPPDVLTLDNGTDIRAYVELLQKQVAVHWYPLIPKAARRPKLKRGTVSVQFAVLRNGDVTDVSVDPSSGDKSLDRAALDGIIQSAPFPRLPSEFKPDRLNLRFHFYYNAGHQ